MASPNYTAEEAIRRAVALSSWISEHHPASFEDGAVPGARIAVTMYSIALEHREASLLLLQQTASARSSAFALARPLLEAYIRGMWAQHCATKQEVKTVMDNNWLPSAEAMIRRLDRVQHLDKSLGATKRLMWNPLSDYAHAGSRQLKSWLGPDGVHPRHTDLDVCNILFHANITALLACMGMMQIASLDDQVHGRRAQQLLDEEKADRGLTTEQRP